MENLRDQKGNPIMPRVNPDKPTIFLGKSHQNLQAFGEAGAKAGKETHELLQRLKR